MTSLWLRCDSPCPVRKPGDYRRHSGRNVGFSGIGLWIADFLVAPAGDPPTLPTVRRASRPTGGRGGPRRTSDRAAFGGRPPVFLRHGGFLRDWRPLDRL